MKLSILCKSKIHRAVVTGADVDYVGSIGIDAELLDRAAIVTGERVSVWNVTTGARVETYAIALGAGSGAVVLNGAAAHHFSRGDIVIVAAFCLTDEPVTPRMILVDERNRWVRDLTHADVTIDSVADR